MGAARPFLQAGKCLRSRIATAGASRPPAVPPRGQLSGTPGGHDHGQEVRRRRLNLPDVRLGHSRRCAIRGDVGVDAELRSCRRGWNPHRPDDFYQHLRIHSTVNANGVPTVDRFTIETFCRSGEAMAYDHRTGLLRAASRAPQGGAQAFGSRQAARRGGARGMGADARPRGAGAAARERRPRADIPAARVSTARPGSTRLASRRGRARAGRGAGAGALYVALSFIR